MLQGAVRVSVCVWSQWMCPGGGWKGKRRVVVDLVALKRLKSRCLSLTPSNVPGGTDDCAAERSEAPLLVRPCVSFGQQHGTATRAQPDADDVHSSWETRSKSSRPVPPRASLSQPSQPSQRQRHASRDDRCHRPARHVLCSRGTFCVEIQMWRPARTRRGPSTTARTTTLVL